MVDFLTADAAAADRIRLPMHFEVAAMREEIEAMCLRDFIYYDVLPLRAPAYTVDTSIPPPAPSDNYADGTWTDWLDTRALKEARYLSQVVDTFREHTEVTLVRLLRLEAGAVVKEHTDPTLGLEQENSVIRLTIPILCDQQVEFYLNDSLVPMRPGECWYLRLSDPHRIINAGDTERINMSIDMVPNQWLRSLLSPAQ